MCVFEFVPEVASRGRLGWKERGHVTRYLVLVLIRSLLVPIWGHSHSSFTCDLSLGVVLEST